jgi:hypothetical protein
VVRIRDPVLFDTGIRIRDGKSPRDKHLASYVRELINNFWGKKTEVFCPFSVADPDPQLWDGKAGTGIQNGKIQIRDKHPETATLI